MLKEEYEIKGAYNDVPDYLPELQQFIGLVSFFLIVLNLIFFHDLGNIAFHVTVNLMMGHRLT